MIFLPFLILIDYWWSYYAPFLPSFFSYLQPQLFITTVLSLFFLRMKNKQVIKFLFIGICIYDVLFSRIYFFRLVTLFLIYRMIPYFKKYFQPDFISYLFFMIFALVFYFLFQYVILLGIGITRRSFCYAFSIIIHSASFHVIYGIILYYFLGIKKRKS